MCVCVGSISWNFQRFVSLRLTAHHQVWHSKLDKALRSPTNDKRAKLKVNFLLWWSIRRFNTFPKKVDFELLFFVRWYHFLFVLNFQVTERQKIYIPLWLGFSDSLHWSTMSAPSLSFLGDRFVRRGGFGRFGCSLSNEMQKPFSFISSCWGSCYCLFPQETQRKRGKVC